MKLEVCGLQDNWQSASLSSVWSYWRFTVRCVWALDRHERSHDVNKNSTVSFWGVDWSVSREFTETATCDGNAWNVQPLPCPSERQQLQADHGTVWQSQTALQGHAHSVRTGRVLLVPTLTVGELSGWPFANLQTGRNVLLFVLLMYCSPRTQINVSERAVNENCKLIAG